MKLMNKCLVILFFVVCSTSAMNEDKPCYLNSLPTDLLNYIASFLMETSEEFIERVAKMHDPFSEVALVRPLPLQAWCPNKVSSIKVRKSVERIDDEDNFLFEYKTQMIIEKDGITYTSKLDNKSNYDEIALSTDGNIIGVYRAQQVRQDGQKNISFKCFFELQKIKLGEDKEGNKVIIRGEKKELPFQTSSSTTISFNKQGTHFIIYSQGIKFQQIRHTIINLKTFKEVNLEEEKKVQETNKLQTYLHDKFVCSKYIQGTK